MIKFYVTCVFCGLKDHIGKYMTLHCVGRDCYARCYPSCVLPEQKIAVSDHHAIDLLN